MPRISKVGTKVQMEVERLDGGLNTKDARSRISPFESPDCQNVVFDDQGSVLTREGTTYHNSVAIGSAPMDGIASYNGSMVAWTGGKMYHFAGSAPTLVTASSGKFASGTAVAHLTYQSILFCSDGTNGPWRYEGPNDFYKMGIDVPSAPTAVSDTSGGGGIAAGSYYYKVAFVNSHAVEGEPGSASTGTTLAASAAIDLTGIPVGSALQGVAKRFIYRSTSTAGTYAKVGELNDNTTTVFEDNTALGAEGKTAESDAAGPTPFTTIALHRERLFIDDSTNRTLLRYTKFETPFISEDLGFIPLNKGDGSNITAIGVQNDLVTVFKTASIWVLALNDPSDDTTWEVIKAPTNLGIVGSKALIEIPRAILFVGKLNERLAGIHIFSGVEVSETQNEVLRTVSVAERIEPTIFDWPRSLWSKIACGSYNNRLYLSVPKDEQSTILDGILWFDLDRIGSGGQPGSWAPWTGIEVNHFVIHEGDLYAGSANSDGRVIKFNSGTFTDADGTAIDSYYWTSEVGGEPAIESWIKDFRRINLWYGFVDGGSGASKIMNLKWRTDGDVGSGNSLQISVDPGGGQWGTMIWGSGSWGGGRTDYESQHSLGLALGRRIQLRFDNDNTTAQAFKVHSYKLLMNLRGQR